MKEICERTGLTDRAVRLYIESGLLKPTEENSCSGRRSIHFSEEDVLILEAIAALRKADFSIADIRNMQRAPEQIQAILDTHKIKLSLDIDEKQRILQSLAEIKSDSSVDYMGIAKFIQQSAYRNGLPESDSAITLKDLQRIMKNRIFSVPAFALLLVGAVILAPLFIRTSFGDIEMSTGGVCEILYTFTWARFIGNLQLFAAGFCMAAAIVLMFLHIISGKRALLIVGGGFCVLSIAAMLLLPDEIRETLYRNEFLIYRNSFMRCILFEISFRFDLFIQSLKFIAPTAAAALSFIGFFRQDEISREKPR